MIALFSNAEWWVGLALVCFIGLMLWLGVHKTAGKALDATAEKIRGELAEAERLRQEAEQLLARPSASKPTPTPGSRSRSSARASWPSARSPRPRPRP